MSFTAYWKTTTGFNTTDYPVTIGKKLKECSTAELTAHCMCGSNSPFGNIAFTAKNSDLGTSSVIKDITGGVMFKEPIVNSKSNEQANEPANSGTSAAIYRRTIFIAHKANVSIPQNAIDDTCNDDIFIVENITAPNKLVYNFTGASGLGTNDGAAITARLGGYDLRHTCQKGQTAYATAPNQVTYTDNTDPNNPVTTNYGICMAFVYVVGDNAFVTIDDHLGEFGFRYKNNDTANQYNFLAGGYNYKSFNSDNDYRLFIGSNPNGTGGEATLAEIFPGCFADPVPNPAVFIGTYYVTTVTTLPVPTIKFKFSLVNGTVGTAVESRTLHQVLSGDTATEARLQQICRTGTYFVFDGQVLKPIIVGGVVVGYGTPDKVSEIDTYTDLNHPVPTGPGGGGGGGDDDDDPSDVQSWGGAYSGAGAFSKFYLCTATDLANLRTWFGGGGSGDEIPDGFDPMGQVLGLLQYPVSISGTALAPEEIVFRSGKTILHTNVSVTRSTGGFLHLDCGYIDISRRMQERGVPFLDFETSLEVYVPFCGTAPLDVQTCVGKRLTCDLYVATATGDVSAVIAAGGHPVAYMSGNMAESLPISSAGYGMYLAACKSTWGNGVSQVMNQLTGGTTDTIKNVNQAALNETLSYSQTGGWGHSELIAESYNNPTIGRGMAGAASAKGAAAIGLIKTGLNVVNAATTGYEQYQRVKHASYTSVSGSFTSCAAWNYPFTPYVKITRPHKQIPDNYKHTAAIPLVETKTLSGAPGLTTCVNPDVSGIANATAQEKDIIYRALVNGVIV